MGFSSDKPILLSAPPYFYAVIPVIISSIVGDHCQLIGLVITFNCFGIVAGFSLLGFTTQPAVRYVGTYLATGAYVRNWAAMNAYQASNIVGQWKRATFAASITACNGLGGIAGSFIFRQKEAPRYVKSSMSDRIGDIRNQSGSVFDKDTKADLVQVHDGNMGQYCIPHRYHIYRCPLLNVFSLCE